MPMQGHELKELRKKAGLSQAELGDEIGMARETIGLMERGDAPIERRTELAVLYAIADRGHRPPTVRMAFEEISGLLDRVEEAPQLDLAALNEWLNDLTSAAKTWDELGGAVLGRELLKEAIARAHHLRLGFGRGFVTPDPIPDLVTIREAWKLTEPSRQLVRDIIQLGQP
ncbi:helix-turn-helix domain-containing protein [Sphingomonas sp. C8-2]|nr:helix-turn-helix domain-containing protein [Sphingomonas sp. C8-2]